MLGEGNPFYGKTHTKETIKTAGRLPITCSCVRRAVAEKVPWLQRHGINKQPWLTPTTK